MCTVHDEYSTGTRSSRSTSYLPGFCASNWDGHVCRQGRSPDVRRATSENWPDFQWNPGAHQAQLIRCVLTLVLVMCVRGMGILSGA